MIKLDVVFYTIGPVHDKTKGCIELRKYFIYTYDYDGLLFI